MFVCVGGFLCFNVSRLSLLKMQQIEFDVAPLQCWNKKESHGNKASQIWCSLKRKNGEFNDKNVKFLLNHILSSFKDYPAWPVRSLLTKPEWDNSKLDSDLADVLHDTHCEANEDGDDKTEDDDDEDTGDESTEDDYDSIELEGSVGTSILTMLRSKLGDKLMLYRILFDKQLCPEEQLNDIAEYATNLIKDDDFQITPSKLPIDVWQYLSTFCGLSSIMSLSGVTPFFYHFIYKALYLSRHPDLKQLVVNDELASKFRYRKSSTYLFKGIQDLHVKLSGSMVKKTQLPYLTGIFVKRYRCNGHFRMSVISPFLEKVIVDFDDETWNYNQWFLDKSWQTLIKLSSHRNIKLFMLCNDDCFQFHHVPIATVLVWSESQIYGSLMKHIMYHNKIEYLVFIDTPIDQDYMLVHHRPRVPLRRRTNKNFYYFHKYSCLNWNALVNTLIVFDYFKSFCPKLVIKCSINAAEQPNFRSFLRLIEKKTDLAMEIVIVVECQADSYSDYVDGHVYNRQLFDIMISDWLNKNYAKLTSNESIKALKFGINVRTRSQKPKRSGFMFDVKKMLTLQHLNDNLRNVRKAIDHDSTRDKVGEKMLFQQWNAILEEIYAKTE